MNLYMGIDIGQEGAIACIVGEERGTCYVADFHKEINMSVLTTLNIEIDEAYCLKEAPIKNLRPGLGGSYARGIEIGKNIGFWELWLHLNGITWKDITAKGWQAAYPEFQQKGGKERAESACIREYGEDGKKLIYGPRGGLKDGRCDALLLALCCKMMVDRGVF